MPAAIRIMQSTKPRILAKDSYASGLKKRRTTSRRNSLAMQPIEKRVLSKRVKLLSIYPVKAVIVNARLPAHRQATRIAE